MVVINLTEGTHTIKWSLSGYNDLTAQIRVSSTGAVTCISVTGGSCSGSTPPTVSINGSTVTGFLKSTSGPPPSDKKYIPIQAENYVQINPPMVKKYSSSSEGNYYVYTPSGYITGGYAKYEFNIPVSGRYKLAALVLADNHNHNSFRVKVDSQPVIVWDISPKTSWNWVHISKRGSGSDTQPQYPVFYNDLSAGKHTIYIYDREELTKLRKLIITNDLNYVPGSTVPTPTNSYDSWIESKGGSSGMKHNWSAYLEAGPAYLGLTDLGFIFTWANYLQTGRYYLGF